MALYRVKALAALLICISAAYPTFVGAAPSPEDSLKDALGLGNYKTLSYQGDDGTEISSTEFLKLVSSGRKFAIIKMIQTHTAILSIDPLGKKDMLAPDLELSIQVGEDMPTTSLPDLGGVARRVGGAGGKPVLVSFFFAECAPCVQEVPDLNAFARAHSDVDVVAVTFDAAADAKAFVAKYGLIWPVLADAQDYIDKIGLKTYPTLALVSSHGKLVALKTGGPAALFASGTTDSALENWVRSALRE